jgi:hypothetical protein
VIIRSGMVQGDSLLVADRWRIAWKGLDRDR